jgi:hypothetical protein
LGGAFCEGAEEARERDEEERFMKVMLQRHPPAMPVAGSKNVD